MANHDKVVTVALVITKNDAGKDVYLYRGSLVPGNVPAEHVKKLTAAGMVGDAPSTAAPAEKPALVPYEAGQDPLGFNIPVLKDWVGDDPARASELHAIEVAAEKPRSSFVQWLEGKVAAANTGGG